MLSAFATKSPVRPEKCLKTSSLKGLFHRLQNFCTLYIDENLCIHWSSCISLFDGVVYCTGIMIHFSSPCLKISLYKNWVHVLFTFFPVYSFCPISNACLACSKLVYTALHATSSTASWIITMYFLEHISGLGIIFYS